LTFIEGTIIDIVFRNEENAYTVLEMDCGGSLVTCVGNIPYLQPGEYVRFYGAYTTHKSYGQQFKVASMESRLPEGAESIKLFLSGGLIKGVGEVLAARIVDEFNEETFDVIESYPERLAEVRGVSMNLALKIQEQFGQIREVRALVMRLQMLGLSINQSMRAYEAYGAAAAEIIEQNPYRLVDDVTGIGFERADRIADHMGMEKYTELRVLSGIGHVLKLAMEEGHTCLPKNVLINKSSEMLQVDEKSAAEALSELTFQGKVVENAYNGIAAIALNAANIAESFDAYKLIQLARSTPRKAVSDLSVETQIKGEAVLSEQQERAILTAVQNTVCVITGGPGTGKTTILNALIGIFERNGMDTALAAPTGRAAKRMEQTTGRPAKTIHRLLEYGMTPMEENDYGQSRFMRNEENPLEADAVIVDEMSMVDVFLLKNLLKALEAGTRLVLVGDADQLPSVGPGNVLKDIIKSETVRVCKLTEVFRQTGNIVLNAHRINQGEPVELYKTGDFVFIPCGDVAQTLKAVEKLYTDAIIQDGMLSSDIQIICPVRKGMIGVYNLNREIRESINPRLQEKNETQYGDTVFREGDKVMQTVNNYSKEWYIKGTVKFLSKGLGVFNGDIGVITQIDTMMRTLTILFDEERVAEYEFNELEQLEHAYAVTVHKSQGSEFDTVIMPLFYGNNPFLTRNLLYTGITRAKNKVVMVGLKKTLDYMTGNNRISKRYTALDHELRHFDRLMESLGQKTGSFGDAEPGNEA